MLTSHGLRAELLWIRALQQERLEIGVRKVYKAVVATVVVRLTLLWMGDQAIKNLTHLLDRLCND